ncbi:MAG: hypothetical protein J7L54_01950, partial [Elusimicrobia bacterium]|nr:hypothetical protein [Elusimicrobiota bacterium]
MKSRMRHIILGAVFFLFPLVVAPFLNDVYCLPKATLLWLSVPLFFLYGGFHFKIEEIPIYLWISIFFIFSVFSLSPFLSFWGNYKYYFHGFFSVFSGFCLFLILKKQPVETLSRFFGLFVFSLFVSCLAGVVLFPSARLSAAFGNPNFLGGVLAMVLPFCFYLAEKNKIYIFFFFFFSVFLLLTYSRASWIGA